MQDNVEILFVIRIYLYIFFVVLSSIVFYLIAPSHDGGFGLIFNEPLAIVCAIIITFILAIIVKLLHKKISLIILLFLIITTSFIFASLYPATKRIDVPKAMHTQILNEYFEQKNIKVKNIRILNSSHIWFHGFKPIKWRGYAVLNNETSAVNLYDFELIESGIPLFKKYKVHKKTNKQMNQ